MTRFAVGDQLSQALLKQILEAAKAHSQDAGAPLLAVFDLDSTLFDVSHRIQYIVRAFAQDKEMQTRWPHECQVLTAAEIDPRDWGIRSAMTRLGLDTSNPRFFAEARDYWAKHFFSNDHLHRDQPYPGAVEYVNRLAKAGAEIMYLTGRDVKRMGEGTVKSLEQWKFPLPKDSPRVHVRLKPDQVMDDAEFKRDTLAALEKSHPEIWFFENEPVIVNMVLQDCPSVEIIFMDSTHSGRGVAPTHLHRLEMKFEF
jgi:hypothetical protein